MRTRNRLVLVLALIGLAALVWMLSGPTHSQGEKAAGVSATPQRAAPKPVRAGADSASSTGPALEGVRARALRDENATTGLFTGRVLDQASNQLIAGAELVFAHEGAAESVSSDGEGRFRFEPSALGNYRLAMVSADGFFSYAPQWEKSPIVLVARAEVHVDGIDIYLTPALEYQGLVVDQEGQPVAGARIVVSQSREGALAGEQDELVSDAKGEFVFRARDYSIVTASQNEAVGHALVDDAVQSSHRLTIELGQNPMHAMYGDMRMPPTMHGSASLSGSVRSQNGEPVPAFNLMLAQQAGLGMRLVDQRAIFDGSGQFRFDDLEEGEYLVTAAASGWAMATVSGRASERGGVIQIELSRGATIYGEVIDAESKQPIELAKISMETSFGDSTSAQPMRVSAVSDADGGFSLSGLRAGRRSVLVSAADHHTRIVSALQIEDGQRLGPLQIELSPVQQGDRPGLELAGIGAMLGQDEAGMLVRGVIEGGGAAEAGVRAQDIITAIDGRSVLELGWEDAIQEIRGAVGSQVRLQLRRESQDMELLVTRRAIRT